MESRTSIVINQAFSTTNLFSVNLQSYGLRFQPRKMIIRQILYAHVAGNDIGTYLLWSSLTGGNIAAVYMGIQGVSMCPQSEFMISSYTPSIDFRLYPAVSAFTGPTGNLTLTLEFIG